MQSHVLQDQIKLIVNDFTDLYATRTYIYMYTYVQCGILYLTTIYRTRLSNRIERLTHQTLSFSPSTLQRPCPPDSSP